MRLGRRCVRTVQSAGSSAGICATSSSVRGIAFSMIHWAASVNDDWYTEALETVDPNLIERILAYNHDDCHATVALRRGVPHVDHAHGG
jgi:hypothetical protein